MGIKEQIASLIETIDEANKVMTNAEDEIKHLQSKCEHRNIVIHSWGSADCSICGKHFFGIAQLLLH
ncbi:MAG TPA: hypothetical protein VK190_02405 [Pseudoneobacillus sp.]|nr:hypothetical protein [Pseudoneobacillus sp.]